MRRLRAHLTDERGIALVFAIVAMAALSSTVVTVTYFSSQTGHQANYGRSNDLSYQYAESALNEALAVVTNQRNDASDPDILPATDGCANPSTHAAVTLTYSGGTGTYTGCYDGTGNDDIWTLTAIGSVANPNATGAFITRKLTAQIDVHIPAATKTLTYANAWGWVIAKGTNDPSNCDETVGVNSIQFPFFVNGDLCMKYTSNTTTGYGLFAGGSNSVSMLQVLGHVTVDPGITGKNPSVGTSGSTVYNFDAGSGCKLISTNGAFSTATGYTTCNSTQHVYPKSGTSTNSPQSLAAPTADFDYYYSRGAPGPSHPCVTSKSSTPSSNWPKFESAGNTSRDNSAGAVNLTPGFDYDCYSNRNGELKWVNSTKKLTVKGTVYIDGDAYISNGAAITYNGWGTLYTSGSILLSNGSKLCSYVSSGNCSTPWWGLWWLTGLLVLAADGNGSAHTSPAVPTGDSVYLSGANTAFQGYMYGTNTIELDASTWFQGPMIAKNEKFNGPFTMQTWSPQSSGPSGTPGETPDGTYANQAANFSG